jgi:hypothetical protein
MPGPDFINILLGNDSAGGVSQPERGWPETEAPLWNWLGYRGVRSPGPSSGSSMACSRVALRFGL